MKPFLVADLFCGAGGSSTGAERAVKALGREMLLVCVNHWPLAIETHQLNHPNARHYIEDITKADPLELVPEGYLDLLMASPECTHFSRARGGKPVNNQSRMAPSSVISWLEKLDVRCLLVENVPEFVTWGPVDANDQPVKSMRGINFEEWIKQIKKLGYKVEHRILNAADYGDATTRKRFFLIARKDKHPLTFPKPTHSKDGGNGLLKWRAAREIIDWRLPGRSIFDAPKYRKHPLSINTRRRIAAGLRKQNSVLAPYFIRAMDLEAETGGSAWPEAFTLQQRAHATPRSMEQPIHAVTASWNGGNTLVNPKVEPFMINHYQANNRSVPRDTGEPLFTITSNPSNYVINPEIKPFIVQNRIRFDSDRVSGIDTPVKTITGHGGGALIEPMILGQQSCSAARTVDKPAMTVATAGALALINPDIVVFHGTSNAQSVDKPMPCQPTKAKLGLSQPQIVKYYGNDKEGLSVEDPLATVTTKDRFGLVEAVILQTDQTGSTGDCTRPVSAPLATIVTKQNSGLAVAEAVLTESLSEDDIDPRRLVWIDGVLYKLDILFRMLSNPELAASHSFNDAERDYEFKGTVAEITKQIGNSVPCGIAASLVGEILK